MTNDKRLNKAVAWVGCLSITILVALLGYRIYNETKSLSVLLQYLGIITLVTATVWTTTRKED